MANPSGRGKKAPAKPSARRPSAGAAAQPASASSASVAAQSDRMPESPPEMSVEAAYGDYVRWVTQESEKLRAKYAEQVEKLTGEIKTLGQNRLPYDIVSRYQVEAVRAAKSQDYAALVALYQSAVNALGQVQMNAAKQCQQSVDSFSRSVAGLREEAEKNLTAALDNYSRLVQMAAARPDVVQQRPAELANLAQILAGLAVVKAGAATNA